MLSGSRLPIRDNQDRDRVTPGGRIALACRYVGHQVWGPDDVTTRAALLTCTKYFVHTLLRSRLLIFGCILEANTEDHTTQIHLTSSTTSYDDVTLNKPTQLQDEQGPKQPTFSNPLNLLSSSRVSPKLDPTPARTYSTKPV